MPTLVHLADERESSSIRKNGIKIGKFRRGIYCMPVLQSFYLSHQWLRELKRRGVNTFVGVYFKLDSKTKVYAGRYNEEHKFIELGEAIKEIQTMDDALGYELIIDRKIEAKEIEKIKSLPQTIGWRYKPRSHGIKPCGCDYCIRGSIKGNRVRQKYDPTEKSPPYAEILSRLKASGDIYEIEDLLMTIRRKGRKGDPTELMFLLDRNSASIDQEIALSLAKYKHKATKSILLRLLEKDDSDTKEYAADSLLELYRNEAELILENFTDEPILKSLQGWREKK
jgi:hypothetical protein